MDKLLYGYNTEERIVAVHQLNDQTIRLYKRMEGKVLHQDVEFFPFFLLSHEALIKGFPKKFWLKELNGGNFYRYIAAFTRWSEMWEAVHFILHQYNQNHSPRISSYQEFKEILVRADAVRQFLLQSGMTFFKGMKFKELVQLHLDVQYAPAGGKNRNKKNSGEQILVITIATSDGKEYAFNAQKQRERTILERCIRCINETDPDVIVGYDLFGTILPTLVRACERSHIPLSIGRDGIDLRTPTGYGGGSGENEWLSFDVFGRHLVDLVPLAEAEIDTKRGEQSFTLTALAKHFSLPLSNENNIPVHKIVEEWNHQPKNIINQSLRNIRIARDVYNHLSPPMFFLAQMCPFNFRMLTQFNAAARIESLMLREYIRQRHSVPRAVENSRAITIPPEIYSAGVFSDVLFAEMTGMYSSIILRLNSKPKTDELGVFLLLLTRLSELQKDMSSEVKGETSHAQESTYNVKALKRLIDSFHIYLGSARGLFSDSDQAEVVLTAGRAIQKDILSQIELFNATIIQSDDDGLFLLSPDNIVGEANQKNFIDRLSSTLPGGTTLELTHRYKQMLSVRKNNYALLDQNDNVLIKGNTLISRGMERFLRVFIQRIIECLLTTDFKRMHHAYATAYTQVMQHKWTPADFCRTDIVRTDTETYQKDLETGQITAVPAMEAAVRSSLFVKANSKVSYYVTGTDAGISLNRSPRLADEWNPHQPDENTAYYLARLHEAIGKFRDFFEPAAFERIITLDEIFGFTDEGIRIVNRRITQEASEKKSEIEEYGIWLAEEV